MNDAVPRTRDYPSFCKEPFNVWSMIVDKRRPSQNEGN